MHAVIMRTFSLCSTHYVDGYGCTALAPHEGFGAGRGDAQVVRRDAGGQAVVRDLRFDAPGRAERDAVQFMEMDRIHGR